MPRMITNIQAPICNHVWGLDYLLKGRYFAARVSKKGLGLFWEDKRKEEIRYFRKMGAVRTPLPLCRVEV